MSNPSPEYSIASIARGYINFENVYQGQPITTPIFLSTQETGKDPEAQTAFDKLKNQYTKQGGFGGGLTASDNATSPFLVAGIPVPMGSLVTVLLPNVPATIGAEDTAPIVYHLMWRMRSVNSFLRQRAPYHLAFNGTGQPDDGSLDVGPVGAAKFAGAAKLREFLLCSSEMIRYAQTEPGGADQWATEHIWAVAQQSQITTQLDRPIFPSFDPTQVAQGDVQQGYLLNGQGNFPVYSPYLTRALGDELLIAVTSTQAGLVTTWDFDSTHYVISLLFGRAGYSTGQASVAPPLQQNPQLGVYVLTGVGP